MNQFDHLARFVFTILTTQIINGVSILAAGPQGLGTALAVVGDKVVGGRQNVGAGPVVLLQFDDPGAGKVFFKIENVADVGTAKGVDTLIIVTDDTEVFIAAGQQFEELVLHRVGVLIFVNHLVDKALLIVHQQRALSFEQTHRQEQQIVKINGIVSF